jgi:hypothetical protein
VRGEDDEVVRIDDLLDGVEALQRDLKIGADFRRHREGEGRARHQSVIGEPDSDHLAVRD